jgi:hypothetical protein
MNDMKEVMPRTRACINAMLENQEYCICGGFSLIALHDFPVKEATTEYTAYSDLLLPRTTLREKHARILARLVVTRDSCCIFQFVSSAFRS